MAKIWTYIKIGSKYTSLHLYVVFMFDVISRQVFRGADRTTILTTINRDINRAKAFSNEMYTICPFLRKCSDALVSAYDIRSYTNIAAEKISKNWKNLLFVLPKQTKHMQICCECDQATTAITTFPFPKSCFLLAVQNTTMKIQAIKTRILQNCGHPQ